ncbi:hypothetical protein [Actinophytocola sp.]|uniref:hypothetical protein n=1 Tax=Actinophytocola sp. TaxID=1872138 RepID=UPI00389A4836
MTDDNRTDRNVTDRNVTDCNVTDDDLAAALRVLGTRLDVPEPPDVTGAVLSRLAERGPSRWRTVVAAAVAALVALVTAMAVSPAVRAAVYDLLRVGGVEIHVDEPAPVRPVPSVEPPLPGERDVSVAEARRAVRFGLRLPTDLGPPATVRLIDGDRVVSMAFGSAHGQVRVDEFDGGLDPMFAKFTLAADVHHVTVAGTPAVWVDRPHPVIYTDRDGTLREETARLAGSTLIWAKDGVTYRVEGELTERQAMGIAESLR